MERAEIAQRSIGRMFSAPDDEHEIARCINAMERFQDQIKRAKASKPRMQEFKGHFAARGSAMHEVDDKECLPQCRKMIAQIKARIAEIEAK